MNDIGTSCVAGAMIPITFGDCFGWLHPCPPGRAGSVAVLLCSGVSQDFSNGYRPFRLLADHLARAGYPVLRFDYPGMGDSADPMGADLWPAWCESVDRAADELRALTGAERLLLVGLRVGGLLAASTAARRDDIAGLVLIEPCLTGRSYVSQLVTEARMRGAFKDAENMEVGELIFTPACLGQMRAASLAELDLPCALPVAIFSRMSSEKLAGRLSSWKNRDVWPDYHELGGLEALLRPSHHCGEAELVPQQLLAWLERVLPAYASSQQFHLPVPESTCRALQGYTEAVLRFGEGEHLAGVLCRPAAEHASDLAVVICNAGGNPRHGFARFGVECARILARAGIASLRFDFSGLGDSPLYRDGVDIQSDVFTEDRTADIGAAVDALSQLGYRRFALHGLCSGAYHVVHGACADPRISILLAVNLPWFSLRPERPGPGSAAQYCMDRLASHNTASLFLFGENDSGRISFERHFGAKGESLPESKVACLCIIPGLDHELTVGWMRRTVSERMIAFLHHHQEAAKPETAEGDKSHAHA